MSAAAAAINPQLLLPRPHGGMVRGAALALAAHAVLLVALTTVVQWRTDAPEAVTAELWSPLPQVAAPRPPPPAPAPPPPEPPRRVEQKAEPPAQPDPQIVIARERAAREKAEAQQRAEKLERERERKARELEAERREKAERDRKAAAEEQRLAKLRQQNMDRLLGQVGTAATGSGNAAQDAGPSKSYAGKVVAAIKPNIVFTDTINGNPAAEVEVRAGPSGTVIARRLVRSSGHKEWDEAVLRAIDRTNSLPRDTDGRVPSPIIVTFRPQE